MNDVTPIRRQYLKVKQQHPGALVLFRLGDFYETFDDDARTVARELEIVLTSREMGKGNRIPMAGIPYHALDNYLARLVSRGYKVAICEQMTPPTPGRGIVEREVTRVVTPGTIVEPALLDSHKNNYLVSLAADDTQAGIAYVDITTSEFATTQLPLNQARLEISRLAPSEIITAQNGLGGWDISGLAGITRLDDFVFGTENAVRTLQEHFGVTSLEGYGCAHLPLAVSAAGAIIHYIRQTQKSSLSQITRLSTYHTGSFMALDEQTLINLEVLQNSRTGRVEGSLLGVIDLTKTPMGSRLIRKWLSQPRLDLPELLKRQEAVAWAVEETMVRASLIALFSKMSDIERLINRIGSGVALPREVVTLRRSLETVPSLVSNLENARVPIMAAEWVKAVSGYRRPDCRGHYR